MINKETLQKEQEVISEMRKDIDMLRSKRYHMSGKDEKRRFRAVAYTVKLDAWT